MDLEKFSQKIESNKELKRIWVELQELKHKYQEDKEAMRKLIDDTEQDIDKLRKQNELMRKTIQDFESDSKADQKKIRMLVKNNAKKRKFMSAPEIADGWLKWSMECKPDDEEKHERWEELDACWFSSEESADEAD